MTNEGKPFRCLWCWKSITTNEDYFVTEEVKSLMKVIRGLHWDCVYQIARAWAFGHFGTDDLHGPKKPHHTSRGRTLRR